MEGVPWYSSKLGPPLGFHIGRALAYKRLDTRSYTLVLCEVSYPSEFEKLEQRGEPFGRPLGFIAATREHLKKRKKTPTRFYKEREHTAEALEVHRARSSTIFFRSLFFQQRLNLSL